MLYGRVRVKKLFVVSRIRTLENLTNTHLFSLLFTGRGEMVPRRSLRLLLNLVAFGHAEEKIKKEQGTPGASNLFFMTVKHFFLRPR